MAEAVQLLVSSLADDSSVVREASMASLRDIASLYVPIFFGISFTSYASHSYNQYLLYRNPLLVLDCCYAVSRGGRRVTFLFSCFIFVCILVLI